VGALRGHPLVIIIAVATVAAAVGFFVVARPQYHPQVMSPPPDHGLPYTVAAYTAADATRAFAREGIALTPRSHSATVTTLGNHGDILEVDAFADRELVEKSGFYDYATSGGRYVHFPRSCGTAIPDAERWRGNVRVIVSCTAAGSDAESWLRSVERALARL
jgi:hypothetical protein